MILEGLDGLLGAVTAVVVGWDELICHLVAIVFLNSSEHSLSRM